ncbi:UDP-glucuronate decarboxylase [Flavipsychrobacter stenotrophus]|uniref:UDP-glucuronate decarboxylase n=1 Tax=Flavipsychrobacter stenotrophus TaxID=2077091 RepID=A0A2S7SS92_9BACT|nr:NAD-dependent epimerase/dehydratase family protein [Flavipsychrobacter stenotrophus]PQJ09477.1 UDP-glucuronate decarboxylase [Flavipsychrobacter stenotrophus]
MNAIIKEDIDLIISQFQKWDKFAGKTVLISGANGFLPAYLVETFMALADSFNTKVIAIVRNKQKAETRFAHLLSSPNLKIVVQDVSESFEIEDKVDFIIHAASQASPKYYGIDPVGTLSANVLGTINLMKIAVKNNVDSFLYFSSGEVYGEVREDQIPIKEDTFGYLNCANVRACYGESKRMGENICVSYHHQYGVKAKIIRPFHTYGPGMALNDGRVFADLVSNIVNRQDIVLHSDGSAIRPFCYLRDATLGFLTVLVDGVDGQAYNVGNPGEEHSILELSNILVSLYPELGLKVVVDIPASNNAGYIKSPIHRNSPDIEKVSQLGWLPEVTVEEGFKRTIASFL